MRKFAKIALSALMLAGAATATTVAVTTPADARVAIGIGLGAPGYYGAGYYGYAWADAIAADMATVFESAPNGFFDKTAGMRMRNEIYAVGDSRDINVSIEKFLGRPRSIEPFLKKIGVETSKSK